MLVEKTVTIDRKTGEVLDVKIVEVPGDPAPYEQALVDFYVSMLKNLEKDKNKEEK